MALSNHLCECGCGKRTLFATRTQTAARIIKGQPLRFVFNHQGRKGLNRFEHRSDGTTALFLEHHNGTVSECFIDTADYDVVKRYRWSAWKSKRTTYVSTITTDHAGKRQTILLHTLLLPSEDEVDHEDHNGLNNRRSNLRPATGSNNSANRRKRESDSRGLSSKFKGVSRRPDTGKFRANIRVSHKAINLGQFDCEEDAALAYDEAAKRHFGEFANLNFPTKGEVPFLPEA